MSERGPGRRESQPSLGLWSVVPKAGSSGERQGLLWSVVPNADSSGGAHEVAMLGAAVRLRQWLSPDRQLNLKS